MKKKLMMVAVLLGALSLGSCVENTESASVEGVRNAKAEQLKSLATLNNAKAEAELILAKAEAAIKEATAEGIKIANELAGIELEIAKAGLTAKLEVAKLKAEADLLRAQANLEAAKAALISAMDQVSAAEKQRVQTLLASADAVLSRINGNRNTLIDTQFAKAGLEAGLTNVKDVQAQSIVVQERIIAKSEALVAEYQKYSQTSKDEALKVANEAEAKAKGLNEVYETANKASISANAKANLAGNNVLNSAYLANVGGQYRVYDSVEGYNSQYVNADGTVGSVFVAGYSKITADTEAINADITTATRNLAISKSVLKDAEKALTDKKTSESYKALEKAVVDAQKAYNDATTTAEKQAAKQALETAENNLKYGAWSEEQAVKTATESVENIEKNLKEATDALAAVSGDNATAYAALVKTWEDAMKARTAAQIESQKAWHNYDVQNTLAGTLRSIANSTTDYATLIQDEKNTISEANVAIAENKSVATVEEAIAQKTSKIAELEQKLKIDEAAYADYMAQIKSLIEAAK